MARISDGPLPCRVWWKLTDDGYELVLTHGIRVAERQSGKGGREDAIAAARALASQHNDAAVCEEK